MRSRWKRGNTDLLNWLLVFAFVIFFFTVLHGMFQPQEQKPVYIEVKCIVKLYFHSGIPGEHNFTKIRLMIGYSLWNESSEVWRLVTLHHPPNETEILIFRGRIKLKNILDYWKVYAKVFVLYEVNGTTIFSYHSASAGSFVRTLIIKVHCYEDKVVFQEDYFKAKRD